MKHLLRTNGRGRFGIGVDLFRLDVETESTLTEEEGIAIEEDVSSEEQSSTAILRIYEDLGEDFWTGTGMTVNRFADELDALGEIKRLNIHINCLGGDCHTGQAIHSLIAEYGAKTTAYIDGVCASAATLVACAADEVVARFNTNYMVHYPWSIVMGNAEAMRKAAEDLDSITKPILSVYKQQVEGKITEHKIRELMEGETWMTAEEARDYGFVDRVKGKVKAIAKVRTGQILCNGRIMNIGKYQYHNVPDYPAVGPQGCPTGAKGVTGKKGKQSMTREEIDPQLVASIEIVAREKERARLAALDAMLVPGLEEIIAQAKEDGREPSEIAMECLGVTSKALTQANLTGQLRQDAAAAGGVPAGGAPTPKPNDKKTKGVSLLNQAFENNAKQRRRPMFATHGNGNGE